MAADHSAGNLAKRLWNSPTFTSWGSIGTRFLSFAFVLPVLLRRLDPADVSIWWLLWSFLSFQALADMGFAPTFTRLIAYAMGGARSLDTPPPGSPKDVLSSESNWYLIDRIWGTMRVIYTRLAVSATVPLALLGTWALRKPISESSEPYMAWGAWGVVLIVSATTFWASSYGAYLQGVNKVALLRRWETLMGVASTLTSFIVLAFGGRLLALVISSQLWALLGAVRNRQLCRAVEEGRMMTFRTRSIDPDVMRIAWPAAWRSALGVSFSRGALYASGFILAQVADAVAVSSYLLAFRLIQVLAEISNAPFYSKLPGLARLRYEGRFREQLAVAQRGMRLAYWTFAVGFILTGTVGASLLTLIGSNVAFPDTRLWALLGTGFFVERYGAMHIQLYSTTNHIIWHWANGVTGSIYLISSFALLPVLGAFAFPAAVLFSYLAFYSWYAGLHDYRLFRTGFFQFERTVVLPPALAVLAFAAAVWAA